MSKRKIINVGVEIHELYQLLIGECRYGYTRNNHLMPWGAYDKVKRYLPLMFKKDPEVALHTACQICEECISEQIVRNFYDGLDDEHRTREEAIKFVEWCLDWIHTNGKKANEVPDYVTRTRYENFYPYNYDHFQDNIKKVENFRYRVFELEEFKADAKKIRELTTEPVSKKDADELLFIKEMGVTQGVMNHIEIKTSEYPVRVIGELIRIIEPKNYAGRIFSIELVKESVKEL